MRFTVKQSDLQDALDKLSKVVDKRANQPILENVLIETGPESVFLTGTDYELALRAKVPATVSRHGAFTFNADRLKKIIGKFKKQKDATVSFEQDGLELAECGADYSLKTYWLPELWCRVSIGKNKFRLAGMPAEEFPPFPNTEGATVRVDGQLWGSMAKVRYAVSTDATRYVLNGALVKIDGPKHTLVATDGHQLARVSFLNGNEGLKATVVLPRLFCAYAPGWFKDGEAWLTIGENHSALWSENLEFVCRNIDGQFPDYERVTPYRSDSPVMVEKTALLHALDVVSLMASDRSKMVVFRSDNGGLSLSSEDVEIGAAESTIETLSESDSVEFGINAKYLVSALKEIESESVLISSDDPLSPIRLEGVEGGGFVSVIMPMRV